MLTVSALFPVTWLLQTLLSHSGRRRHFSCQNIYPKPYLSEDPWLAEPSNRHESLEACPQPPERALLRSGRRLWSRKVHHLATTQLPCSLKLDGFQDWLGTWVSLPDEMDRNSTRGQKFFCCDFSQHDQPGALTAGIYSCGGKMKEPVAFRSPISKCWWVGNICYFWISWPSGSTIIFVESLDISGKQECQRPKWHSY